MLEVEEQQTEKPKLKLKKQTNAESTISRNGRTTEKRTQGKEKRRSEKTIEQESGAEEIKALLQARSRYRTDKELDCFICYCMS